MDLKNSVIAITGAGQGLGQMMAVSLAQAGADLALLDVNETGLLNTQEQCRMLSAKALIYRLDVTNESEVEETFDEIIQDFGQLIEYYDGPFRDSVTCSLPGNRNAFPEFLNGLTEDELLSRDDPFHEWYQIGEH